MKQWRLAFRLWRHGRRVAKIKALGGEVRTFVAVPTYRDPGVFTEMDWHELVALPTQNPALFRYLNKNMAEIERQLYTLPESPEYDRKRLKYHTMMETYHWFIKIPETALHAIERLKKEAKEKEAAKELTNLGEIN